MILANQYRPDEAAAANAEVVEIPEKQKKNGKGLPNPSNDSK